MSNHQLIKNITGRLQNAIQATVTIERAETACNFGLNQNHDQYQCPTCLIYHIMQTHRELEALKRMNPIKFTWIWIKRLFAPKNA